ncbi:MAG: protein O-GlcNAcase [bacterium]|nr:protein O-GlcNAcase [bacterium]
MTSTFFEIRGIAEAFYGVFYTAPERDDLIRFMGQHGYNFYLYGPKNDRQHRMRWREPYPAKIMRQFMQTIAVAQEAGVAFCYSLSPGVDMVYASQSEFDIITAKFRAFYDIGVRDFSLLLDDIDNGFQHNEDRQRYKTYAEAHVDLCHRTYDWLMQLDPTVTFSMCPTDYHGSSPFTGYLHQLGAELRPEIDIYYTGIDICSPMITTSDAALFAEVAHRRPVLWDNYPVNDLSRSDTLQIGPVQGRDADLYKATRGILVNPMIQIEASKIPLSTYADYLNNPETYQPEEAWQRALEQVTDSESANAVRLFAENSLSTIFGTPEAPRLHMLTEAAMQTVRREDYGHDDVKALERYLDELDEATYHLKFRMDNLALRNNLLPWIEKLEYWFWTARFALRVLRALQNGGSYEHPLNMMKEFRQNALNSPRRIGGRYVEPLADYALEKVQQRELVR